MENEDISDTGTEGGNTVVVAVQTDTREETPPLTPEDQILLETLDRKLMVVRDRVRSVVKQYTTGFFLYGEGGNCKSYTVTGELDRLGADYKVHNSRMTGRGLFDVLEKHPARSTCSKTWKGCSATRWPRGCSGQPCGASGGTACRSGS